MQITVPDSYPAVVLCNVVVPAATLLYLGGRVGAARKRLGVKLPDMQAIPGKGLSASAAKEFNCVQRGHHNPLETNTDFYLFSLIAGLIWPRAVAAAGIVWSASCIEWARQYRGDGSRYTKGLRIGGLRWLAHVGVLGASIYACVGVWGLGL
jgi:hypothetical protein